MFGHIGIGSRFNPTAFPGITGDSVRSVSRVTPFVPSADVLLSHKFSQIMRSIDVAHTGTVNIADLSVSNFNIGDGTMKSTVINGIAFGLITNNAAEIMPLNTTPTPIKEFEISTYNVGDNLSINRIKTSILENTYIDQQGVYYGLIRSRYNVDLGFTDDSMFGSQVSISQLEVGSTEEIVVLGVTFGPKIVNIFIPNVVKIGSDEDVNSMPVYYPVREIWSWNIYARVGTSMNFRPLTVKELSSSNSINFVPASIHAPYITKISLKRNIYQENNYAIFSGICAKTIYMPNLRKIVGVSGLAQSPVFCSLNNKNSYLEELRLPALEEIKNCLFCCNNKHLVYAEFPKLAELHETIFMRGCPKIKEMHFPSLKVLQGCDFFMAYCYNLKKIHFPETFKLQPHELIGVREGSRISIGSNIPLADVYNTFEFTDITFGVRFNGTNSMSYFLHGDIGLMNVSKNVDAEYKKNGYEVAPYNKNGYTIDPSAGIDFDYPAISLPMHPKAYVGGMTENIKQYCNRVGITEFPVPTEGKFTYSNIEFAIDPTTHLVVCTAGIEHSKEAGGVLAQYIAAVDPRTSLMSTMTAARGMFHRYEDEAKVGIAFNIDKKFVIPLIAAGQYYTDLATSEDDD